MPVANPKFTLYKHIKIDGQWRYFRAALSGNNKVKPHVVVIDGEEQKHEGGSYCVRNGGKWIDVGNDPAEALRQRTKLAEELGAEPEPVAARVGTPLEDAADTYFRNLESQGKDHKTIRSYHTGVDPFVKNCKKATVEEVTKQDLIDFMGWLRKQPVPVRKHGNPERTMANKVLYVAIFLKAFGREKLLKKKEYPRYHEKKVVAHTESELDLLYSHADPEEWFLLDYFLGTMARNHEAYNCKYTDLTGTTLTLYGKQHKTRTVEISQRLADGIQARRKSSKSELLFPNGVDKPDTKMCRSLQLLAKRAGASFHTELHKLRKTGASRRYLKGVGLPTLMQELGHESLATTQKYLADVRREDEIKKAVADADFVPKPKVVKTGTDGD
jgi:integrase